MTSAIIKKLQALNIKRVAVFDDEIEELRNIWGKDDNWESIFTTYIDVLETNLGIDQTNTIRELKNIEERQDSLRIIGQHLTTEQLAALTAEAETVSIVRLWIEKLKSFGLNVDTYTDFDDFKSNSQSVNGNYKVHLGKYDLILLDFNFEHKSGGAHSELISREISELLNPLASEQVNTPPILIRFSSLDLSDYSAENMSKFAKDIGFARGCYDFLRKNLIREEESFITNLMRIIQSAEYGRPLYALSLNIAKTISQTAASDVMRILYRLDPESIRIMSEHRLMLEGSTSDYFTKLFIGLLNNTIAGSEDVVKATKEFLDSITVKEEPISVFEHEGLDFVQNKLLFDYKVNRLKKPINFGDIFLFKEGNKNRVGILITQSCDMAIRGQSTGGNPEVVSGKSKPKLPKVEYVMLLTGILIPLPPTLAKGESKEATLFTKFFAKVIDEEHYFAIKWNLQRTISLPRTLLDLVSLNFEGEVILPLSEDVTQSEFWSNAYQNYINWVCKYLRDNHYCVPKQKSTTEENLELNQNGGEEIVKVVLTGASSEDLELSTFGSAIVFPTIKSDTDIKFPIQRIARLQIAETLELQHAYHTYASRIGVMAEFSQEYTDAKVELYERGSEPFAIIPAKQFKIGDWSALIIYSHELESACKNKETFSNLAIIAANGHSTLNLVEISKCQNFIDCFTFKLQGSAYQIRKIRNREPSKPPNQKVTEKDVDSEVAKSLEKLEIPEMGKLLEEEKQTLKVQIEQSEPN